MEAITRLFEVGSPAAIALFGSLLTNFFLLRTILRLVGQKTASETAMLQTLQTASSALTDAASAARETSHRVAAMEIAMSRVESSITTRAT